MSKSLCKRKCHVALALVNQVTYVVVAFKTYFKIN